MTPVLKSVDLGRIVSIEANIGDEEVRIVTNLGTVVLWHEQDCCENVCVEDVCGDPIDHIDALVLSIEERTSESPQPYGDSGTWTFYEIRTTKGDITIRFLGTSNGYYSESVSSRFEPVS